MTVQLSNKAMFMESDFFFWLVIGIDGLAPFSQCDSIQQPTQVLTLQLLHTASAHNHF